MMITDLFFSMVVVLLEAVVVDKVVLEIILMNGNDNYTEGDLFCFPRFKLVVRKCFTAIHILPL